MGRQDGKGSMTFGQVIRQRRMELGLTQEELAERVGENIRQSEISRLERDYIMLPRRSRLEAIARALEVSPIYLLMRSGWMEEDDSLGPSATPETPVKEAPETSPAVASYVAPEDGSPPDSKVTAVIEHASMLREAIARAREVQEHTGELLRESTEVLDQASRRRPPLR
jgi:transcriptional regulator with XRE-family HTH domain